MGARHSNLFATLLCPASLTNLLPSSWPPSPTPWLLSPGTRLRSTCPQYPASLISYSRRRCHPILRIYLSISCDQLVNIYISVCDRNMSSSLGNPPDMKHL